MLNVKGLFGKPKKYAQITDTRTKREVPDGVMIKCPKCKKIAYSKELQKNLKVCMNCDYHHPLHATERLENILDENTFVEYDKGLQSSNPLQFPSYLEKLEDDKEKTNMNEAIVTGHGEINGMKTVVAVMDSRFRMGSMGTVVGEKIVRAIMKASELKVPFIIFTASGGARMQEGVLSLMQMGKTSVALKRYSDNGGLIISVMTHPTTGGVSASFASLGDYNLAEPGALIGFAGRRVIEQTVREKLPEDFQTSEFLLKHGQLDKIVHRAKMKEVLATILDIHQGGEENA